MKLSEVEKDVKQRVLQVLDECKISVNKLASSFGANTRTLNDQINGDSKISAATLIALADFRQDLSAEWLLRGEGEMFRTPPEPTDERDTTEVKAKAKTVGKTKISIELEIGPDEVVKMRLKDGGFHFDN